MICPNLKQLFGKRYKIECEESYRAQYGPRARTSDPWRLILPCKHGNICPWGPSTLAAVTDKAGAIAKRLRALPGVILWQDGSDGATILFPLNLFDQVATIMRPRRRRCLSEEQRRESATRLAKVRPQSLRRSDSDERPCVRRGSDDLEHEPHVVERFLPQETGLVQCQPAALSGHEGR
jgi:hypothetical protein